MFLFFNTTLYLSNFQQICIRPLLIHLGMLKDDLYKWMCCYWIELKTLWQKVKLLIKSNFSFCKTVWKCFLLHMENVYTRQCFNWIRLKTLTNGSTGVKMELNACNYPLIISAAIPPVCSPTEISKTFRETQPRGSCLDVEVKCTDPTDPTGSKLSVQSTSGSGAQLLEIRRATSDSFLGINACTNTSLRERFGTYEVGTFTI